MKMPWNKDQPALANFGDEEEMLLVSQKEIEQAQAHHYETGYREGADSARADYSIAFEYANCYYEGPWDIHSVAAYVRRLELARHFDYAKMLTTYIDHVGDEEGTTFVNDRLKEKVSEEEFEEIFRLERLSYPEPTTATVTYPPGAVEIGETLYLRARQNDVSHEWVSKDGGKTWQHIE